MNYLQIGIHLKGPNSYSGGKLKFLCQMYHLLRGYPHKPLNYRCKQTTDLIGFRKEERVLYRLFVHFLHYRLNHMHKLVGKKQISWIEQLKLSGKMCLIYVEVNEPEKAILLLC